MRESMLCLFAAFLLAGCPEDDSSQANPSAGSGGAGTRAGAGASGSGAGAAAGAGAGTIAGAGTAGSVAGTPAIDASVAEDGGVSAVDCDPRKILCKRLALACPEGQVPSVSGSCYGDCVSPESCACDEAADCPDDAHYTCHMSAGHCGPYVN